jgi:hypothetical protein
MLKIESTVDRLKSDMFVDFKAKIRAFTFLVWLGFLAGNGGEPTEEEECGG